jgi:hypothetical protein
MAVKKPAAARTSGARQKAETEPKFPYTTKPSSLRRLLQEIPKRPKPPKFDRSLLQSWGFSDANDYSMIRVLKAVGLIGSTNEPTELYSQFMHIDGGAAALGKPIKRVYEPLFSVSHAPYSESIEKLQNLFNIHSGGGVRALDQQIQTFKSLCDYASFDDPLQARQQGAIASPNPGTDSTKSSPPDATAPAVHINVHIHLPENKTRRDYETIIEDIGRYIFGRMEAGPRGE